MAASLAPAPSLTSMSTLLQHRPSLFHSPSLRLGLPQLSLPRGRSHLAPLVAQASGWTQQEVELDAQLLSGGEEGQWTEAAGAQGEGQEEEDYAEPPEEAKLFVGGIPFDITSEKLAEIFDAAGTVEVAEIIYNRETDQSRGFGFVTMSTVEEADKAIEMFDRYEVNGRLLKVNRAAPRGTRAERQPRESRPQFSIYVGNLSWGVDEARLEQVFSEFGKVVSSRVMYDRESGRSRGFGFVAMETKEEMNDAIAALDGKDLDGRALRVNIAEDRRRAPAF